MCSSDDSWKGVLMKTVDKVDSQQGVIVMTVDKAL